MGSHGSSLAGIGWTVYVGAILVVSGVVNLAGITGQNGKAQAFMERLPMGAAAVVIGALLLLPGLMRLKQSVDVFERGLIWNRLLGARTVSSNDVKGIKHIHHSSKNGSYDEVELLLQDGSSYSINGLKGADQVVSYVRAWGNPAPAAAAVPAAAAWSPPAGGWKPPA